MKKRIIKEWKTQEEDFSGNAITKLEGVTVADFEKAAEVLGIKAKSVDVRHFKDVLFLITSLHKKGYELYVFDLGGIGLSVGVGIVGETLFFEEEIELKPRKFKLVASETDRGAIFLSEASTIGKVYEEIVDESLEDGDDRKRSFIGDDGKIWFFCFNWIERRGQQVSDYWEEVTDEEPTK